MRAQRAMTRLERFAMRSETESRSNRESKREGESQEVLLQASEIEREN